MIRRGLAGGAGHLANWGVKKRKTYGARVHRVYTGDGRLSRCRQRAYVGNRTGIRTPGAEGDLMNGSQPYADNGEGRRRRSPGWRCEACFGYGGYLRLRGGKAAIVLCGQGFGVLVRR